MATHSSLVRWTYVYFLSTLYNHLRKQAIMIEFKFRLHQFSPELVDIF
jgi:hypothetical protein